MSLSSIFWTLILSVTNSRARVISEEITRWSFQRTIVSESVVTGSMSSAGEKIIHITESGFLCLWFIALETNFVASCRGGWDYYFFSQIAVVIYNITVHFNIYCLYFITFWSCCSDRALKFETTTCCLSAATYSTYLLLPFIAWDFPLWCGVQYISLCTQICIYWFLVGGLHTTERDAFSVSSSEHPSVYTHLSTSV